MRSLPASLDTSDARMRAVRRFHEQTGTTPDRRDAMEADLLAFRAEANAGLLTFHAEAGGTLKRIHGDILARENQNIARHGETTDLMNRMRHTEVGIEGLRAGS